MKICIKLYDNSFTSTNFSMVTYEYSLFVVGSFLYFLIEAFIWDFLKHLKTIGKLIIIIIIRLLFINNTWKYFEGLELLSVVQKLGIFCCIIKINYTSFSCELYSLKVQEPYSTGNFETVFTHQRVLSESHVLQKCITHETNYKELPASSNLTCMYFRFLVWKQL